MEDVPEDHGNASEDHVDPALSHTVDHPHVVVLVVLGNVGLLQVDLCNSGIDLGEGERGDGIDAFFPLATTPLQLDLLTRLVVRWVEINYGGDELALNASIVEYVVSLGNGIDFADGLRVVLRIGGKERRGT